MVLLIFGAVVEKNVSVLVAVEATVAVEGVDDIAFVKSCASEAVVALLAIEIPMELVVVCAAVIGVLVDVLVIVGIVVVEDDKVAPAADCVAEVAVELVVEVKLVVVLVGEVVLVVG